MKKVEHQQEPPARRSSIGRMVAVSAVLHLIVIFFILFVSSRNTSDSSPRLIAHTVELVAPRVLGPAGGGDSGMPSGGRPSPPLEKKSPPPMKPERTESPGVKRQPERTSEKPAKPPVKEPAPQVPPKPKVKETEKDAAAKPQPRDLPPPVPKPKPAVEPVKPKEAVKLPENNKKTEPPPPKKMDKKPEPEKVATKVDKKLVEKDKPPDKPVPPENKRPQRKTVDSSQKSEATPVTQSKEQKSEPVKENKQEKDEHDEKILAAVERIRAQEEEAEREKGIAEALARVRKGVAAKEEKEAGDGTRGRRESSFSSGRTEGEEKGTGSENKSTGYGAEFIAYTQAIKQKVKEAWILAERRPSLRAVVRFGLTPEGQVVETELAASSGDRAFDQSALRAVSKASPFPAPPEAYREEFALQKIEITFSGAEQIR